MFITFIDRNLIGFPNLTFIKPSLQLFTASHWDRSDGYCSYGWEVVNGVVIFTSKTWAAFLLKLLAKLKGIR